MHENAAGELFFVFFESGYELSDTVASFLGTKKKFCILHCILSKLLCTTELPSPYSEHFSMSYDNAQSVIRTVSSVFVNTWTPKNTKK